MSHPPPDRRRRALLAAGLYAGVVPVALAGALQPTPRQPAGPFYPVELPLDDDADLTFVTSRAQPAEGDPTELTGRLLDTGGRPLAGTRIEIWQCDARGYYLHPRDRGGQGRDPNFQGHGHAVSDADGNYRFRTIHPVEYPGRTPHIHVAVFRPGERPFVTQLYVRDEPGNADDFLFNSVPVEKRELVLADFVARESSGKRSYAARFDVILGAVPEQV